MASQAVAGVTVLVLGIAWLTSGMSQGHRAGPVGSQSTTLPTGSSSPSLSGTLRDVSVVVAPDGRAQICAPEAPKSTSPYPTDQLPGERTQRLAG